MAEAHTRRGSIPFDEFVQTRILAPLKMNDTFFQVPEEKRSRVAKTYGFKDGKLGQISTDELRYSASVPFGGMGLFSTIGDYARFGQMLLNEGQLDGARLLGRKTVELMTVNHLNSLAIPHTNESGAYGFGLGGSVRVDLAKGNIPGSLASSDGMALQARTFAWIRGKELCPCCSSSTCLSIRRHSSCSRLWSIRRS